ncbi:hypothetical protein JAO73_16230 [Hymenobacter sp. BT523]|uniref:hypothetical protein n=1 Tax=Hymenobacter sp. BT523 TaxID=2795725 RepID=UPI0018ECFCD0|nr:hypothetical protein [Hymenobacter sp. BT523]MBJ6110573.1 hypothetical protein [Hymenobacter sp. BT523]
MADINIQRKKASPSPWILVLLAVAAVAVAAYFFLRPDPADEPAPPANTGVAGAATDTTASATADTAAPAPADTAAGHTFRQSHNPAGPGGTTTAEEASTETAASLAAQAATDPAAPGYARNGLQKLTGVLVSLTDRDDLRDPTITEQRDNLTSATDRLGDPKVSLRPGFVAAASLIRAMQQKAYPELESQAAELTRLADQLSGRSATAADQQQTQQFLTKAADIVRALSEPTQHTLN